MINLTLTKIKEQILRLRTVMVIGVGITVITAITGAIIITKPQKREGATTPFSSTETPIPPPLNQQPVVNGKFDPSAPASQRSKAAIDKLKPYLAYSKTITTSTGSNITFTVFTRPTENYTLRVKISNLNFQADYNDPNLPKTVQDFRETAAAIFDFMNQHGINPGDVFISWGSTPSYIQKNAEAWLVPSPQFPKVIAKNGQFVFETEPIRP